MTSNIPGTLHPSRSRRRWLLKALGVLAVLGALLCGGLYFALIIRPEIGAQGADLLRQVVGQQPVAQLETVVYNTQDAYNQWLADAGLKEAQAPWQVTAQPATGAPKATTAPSTPTRAAPAATAPAAAASAAPLTPTPVPPAPQRQVWVPAAIPPFTKLAGEGQWQPYILDSSGRSVAYRTFVLPDSDRPYAVVGIVAFDLQATQLHFVLGSQEPKSAVTVERSGRIPEADTQPGTLLAVFNGGFKADHGQYGAMFKGITVLPPIKDHMTVAIDADGTVRMGAWGQDPVSTAATVSWRQNGPPIIHAGQINPLTADMTARNWGANIDGSVAVWRSGLGISRDGRVLYYAAGDSLVVSTLAHALQAAGAYHAMQLDINNYWVYFGAVTASDSLLTSTPLLPKMSASDPKRYLSGFSRDFFYITARVP